MNDQALIADLKRAVSDLFNAREECAALRAELGQARADVAKLRAALQRIIDYASAAGTPRLHAIAAEALAATQDPPILDATLGDE